MPISRSTQSQFPLLNQGSQMMQDTFGMKDLSNIDKDATSVTHNAGSGVKAWWHTKASLKMGKRLQSRIFNSNDAAGDIAGEGGEAAETGSAAIEAGSATASEIGGTAAATAGTEAAGAAAAAGAGEAVTAGVAAGEAAGVAAGAATGAEAGGAAGSIIPGAGTLIGAAVGLVGGIVVGGIMGHHAQDKAKQLAAGQAKNNPSQIAGTPILTHNTAGLVDSPSAVIQMTGAGYDNPRNQMPSQRPFMAPDDPFASFNALTGQGQLAPGDSRARNQSDVGYYDSRCPKGLFKDTGRL